ncbi:MAG: zinc-dependent MarR family transcriptional regulator [Streptococcaceae bacterium]|jgi:DNA-binding MarR family transcriptional regulator|nr:zinc-dependent MarR family transcriptional regulator [Streptococcaceae bacterium]
MQELANQIDDFFVKVVRFAEKKHEVLLGNCVSNVKLTSTQEHILMLLKKRPSTNAKMADRLMISAAAVTKALKKLQELSLIASTRDEKDERVIYWHLTHQALPIAAEHAEHHHKTLGAYQKILDEFTEEEKSVISRFLKDLKGEFE